MSRLFQILLTLVVCQIGPAQAQQSSNYQLLETVDHNPAYFTQGLEVLDGIIYESSGRYGKSMIRKYHPDGDSTLLEKPLADKYFAEGLTLFAEELFVLTWKENTLLVLNPENLKTKRKLNYQGEGWGLASNTTHLIMSNGSDRIVFRNPETFEVERDIQVRSQQHSVRRINELEFAQGYIWANIWQSPVIVKINPATGNVKAFFDLSKLVAQHTSGYDDRVLNGIAYDPQKNAYWITGKLWPKRYLLRFE